MGYSNYWTQDKSFSDDEWKQIKDEYNYIKTVFGEFIEDQTESDNQIAFNGKGEENQCETFILLQHANKTVKYERHNPAFNFCKTRQLPYDLAVWHLLTFIKQFGIAIERDCY